MVFISIYMKNIHYDISIDIQWWPKLLEHYFHLLKNSLKISHLFLSFAVCVSRKYQFTFPNIHLAIIIQWDLSLHKESDNSRCSTQSSIKSAIHTDLILRLKSTPTLIFVQTGFDMGKCLASRQGLSRRTHFFLSEYFFKCKLFLQLVVLNCDYWWSFKC